MYAWEISANYKKYLLCEGFEKGGWIDGEYLMLFN